MQQQKKKKIKKHKPKTTKKKPPKNTGALINKKKSDDNSLRICKQVYLLSIASLYCKHVHIDTYTHAHTQKVFKYLQVCRFKISFNHFYFSCLCLTFNLFIYPLFDD